MPKSDGFKNLKPFNGLSEEEKREIQEKGRQANKKKWEEKKLLKDLLEYGLSLETESGNNAIEITQALISKAISGDVRAYEVIRDTIGQKPREDINLTGELNNPYKELTAEELRKIAGD